jgi:hypothetical protein
MSSKDKKTDSKQLPKLNNKGCTKSVQPKQSTTTIEKLPNISKANANSPSAEKPKVSLSSEQVQNEAETIASKELEEERLAAQILAEEMAAKRLAEENERKIRGNSLNIILNISSN